MVGLILIVFIFFAGCGEIEETGQEGMQNADEYIIITPASPPCIQFQGTDLGEMDTYENEQDVSYPVNPISSPPEIDLTSE